MLIDWFTVVAQIINFIILVFLLRRFLYRPILKAMDDRQKLVASRLEQAEQKRLQAEEQYQRYQSQNQALQEQYEEKQREAEEIVEGWQKEALHQAREKVEATSEEWQRAIRQEQNSFAADLEIFAIRQTYAIARQAMRDLADITLEEKMVALFLARLASHKAELAHIKITAGQELVLRSAFELSPDLQKHVEQALRGELGDGIMLRYEVTPDLDAGIELVGEGGHQFAWNLRRYLDALEDELENQLLSIEDQATGELEQAEASIATR